MSALRRFLDPETTRDLLRLGAIVLTAYGLGAITVLASFDALHVGVGS